MFLKVWTRVLVDPPTNYEYNDANYLTYTLVFAVHIIVKGIIWLIAIELYMSVDV